MTLTLPFPCSEPYAGQLFKHDLALRDDNGRQSATCAVCVLIRCRGGATVEASASSPIAREEDSHGDGKEPATCRLRGSGSDDSINELERYGGSLRAPERWRTFSNPNGVGSHRLLPGLAWSGGSRHSWGLGTCAGL